MLKWIDGWMGGWAGRRQADLLTDRQIDGQREWQMDEWKD